MEDGSDLASFQFVIPYDEGSKIKDYESKRKLWASPDYFGFDYKEMKPRGVLLLNLADDDSRTY